MKYSIGETVKNIYSLLMTKFFFKKAKLVRYPIYIRGKDKMSFGEGFTTGYGCRLDALSKSNKKILKIGKNCQINDYVHIGAIENIEIGDNVLIASKVFITDHNHGSYETYGESPETIPKLRKLYSKKIEIQDNVWIGENVSILQGVKIGKGAIIGANSVVKSNIPEYTIAVGVPTRVVKKYNFNLKKWERI